MKITKVIGKIHLWLGLSSGLVVFIVAITGCIYAFQSENQDLTQSYRFCFFGHDDFRPGTLVALK